MWADNETDKDFLNFSGVADTVAEIISQAEGRPISIGVSGAWGVGKSSMLKLIRSSLAKDEGGETSKTVFVEFNAWLYQGYDDTRAALLEVIAKSLVQKAERQEGGAEKAKDLLGKVNWLRTAQLFASLIPLGLGAVDSLPAAEATVKGGNLVARMLGAVTAGGSTRRQDTAIEDLSPASAIHAVRDALEQTLSEMGVKLVVLIDDLDRCLPRTTISTLEAIRLFLFMQDTAFVIAADETMIKHAVRRHFEGVDDAVATNYFDKLIQVPIRVPPLGTQEVRAYMMLLFVENSSLPASDKERLRLAVCKRLADTWKGLRVDSSFIRDIQPDLPHQLVGQLDSSHRLAPVMASASQIGGNPRLIKRFMNALSIRMSIARTHGVAVDEAVLAKMLLFERCAPPAAYNELTQRVNNDIEGKPRFLEAWEDETDNFGELVQEESWKDPFILEWLTIAPRLAEIDLRGVLYVSREHAPLVSAEDRLSSEGVELLGAILEFPQGAVELGEKLVALPRLETSVIMDRLLEQARKEEVWGSPPILDGIIALTTADPVQEKRLAAFLAERPPSQIQASIVPKIGDQPWAEDVFASWHSSSVSPAVKAAITRERKNRGDI